MEVKVNNQRLDSTHVLSDMGVLGRSQMMGVALRRFFHQLDKHAAGQLPRVPEDIRRRYCKQSDSRIFGDAATTEKRRIALRQVAEDMACVLSLFAETQPVSGWKTFFSCGRFSISSAKCARNLSRFVRRPAVPSFRARLILTRLATATRGAGYQVQVCETFNEDGDANLITSATVETAVVSDADAVEPTLDDLKDRDLLPDELLADAGCGSEENVAIAESQEVTLTAPVPGESRLIPKKSATINSN